MSGPTGGRNSKAPTPEHPTPCVASKLCPTRADWIITHRNIQRHGDDPKLYVKSFHTPEHPTPHMESVSHAGTSNAASETSNWGRYLRSVITQLLSKITFFHINLQLPQYLIYSEYINIPPQYPHKDTLKTQECQTRYIYIYSETTRPTKIISRI